jgi:FkbM family methyltransferase
VDLRGAVLELVVGRISPRLRGRIEWRAERRAGDRAPLVAEHLVAPGDVVLDIGASWGLYAYGLSRLVGASGRVHAFEPGPGNLRPLSRIAGDNVTVHALGLSDSGGEAVLRAPAGRRGATTALASLEPRSAGGAAEYRSVSVPVRRLDDVAELRGVDVAFVKCDVEGHERAVFAGAGELLGRCMPAILVEIEQRHQDGDIRELIASLVARGYDGYVLRHDGLRPVAEFDVERDQLTHLDPGGALPPGAAARYLNNFLFVPPARDVAALMAP